MHAHARRNNVHMGASACTCMHAHAHACTCTWTHHVYIAILISKVSSKFHCQVSLPALQVAFGIAVSKLLQSFIAKFHCQVSFAMEQPLDPEVAFGPQQEWESPRQERPWLGHNAASLIPDGANEEEIIEALELWGMPAEAWPQMDKKKKGHLCNYTLQKKDHPDIHVYLGRQMFTTQPANEKHTYFSFWMSAEFEVGPVANPYGIGNPYGESKGYNHCNATLAFGEIQLLAGWSDEPFLLQWHSQFNLHRLPDQQFPPVLHEWVLLQPDGMAAMKMLQDAHAHVQELIAQDAPSLLDVDQIYLAYENGAAAIINVDEIGPDAKKKMVEGREVIKLCDDGIHRVVWEVPRTVDGDWQCL